MTEAERYLAKAKESLASARADNRARRYNSAANRAYYAAFQAAVAALINAGIRPADDDWGHRFVMSQFSGKLIRRRKLLPRTLRPTLNNLFDRRVKADYRSVDTSRRTADDSARRAASLVRQVDKMGGSRGIAETKAKYEGRTMPTARETRRKAKAFVDEIKGLLTKEFPDCEFRLIERSPKDYRLIVRGSFRDDVDIQDVLDGRTTDILVDHDIWIVILAESKREAA